MIFYLSEERTGHGLFEVEKNSKYEVFSKLEDFEVRSTKFFEVEKIRSSKFEVQKIPKFRSSKFKKFSIVGIRSPKILKLGI